MSGRILVAYGTKSGSTAEVADAIGRALADAGISVDVRRAREVRSTAGYDAVVLGGPRVSSTWQPDVIDLLGRLHEELAGKPVAYFITSMTLTRIADARVGPIPIFQDPAHSRPPQREGKLSFKEKETTPSAYLRPVLRKAPDIVPVHVAFFAGKLDFGKLDFLSRTLIRVVFGIPEGDSRNLSAIRSWAQCLSSALWPDGAPAQASSLLTTTESSIDPDHAHAGVAATAPHVKAPHEPRERLGEDVVGDGHVTERPHRESPGRDAATCRVFADTYSGEAQ
jgi:menaquinone-dependent protoporphyrinogen oxidase